MLILLSPAKKLSPTKKLKVGAGEQPLTNEKKATKMTLIFEDKVWALAGRMKGFDVQDLMKLMGISEKIARLNVTRYENFKSTPTQVAAYMFRGDTYVGFDADSLGAADFSFADEHIRILSGLYGVLRAGDAIKPYRLEMGTTFGKGDNLYTYWQESVTTYLKDELARQGGETIVNLASAEYAKVVDTKQLKRHGVRCLDFVFKDSVSSGMKVVGVLAKKARGLYARSMVDASVQSMDDLEAFQDQSIGGYVFSKQESSQDRWVFMQENGR